MKDQGRNQGGSCAVSFKESYQIFFFSLRICYKQRFLSYALLSTDLPMTVFPERLSFLSPANATFIGELYAKYLVSPASVDESWATFFGDLRDDEQIVLAELSGASWGTAANQNKVIGAAADEPAKGAKDAKGKTNAPAVTADAAKQAALDSVRALMLVRAYRARGHLLANLDPLGLIKKEYHPELDPKAFGFTDADMDRPIYIGDGNLGLPESPTLRTILDTLRATYCGSIGVEFLHIQDPDQKAWLQDRIEGIRNKTQFSAADQRWFLERLTAAEGLEKFLQLKYTGTKRFGLEGGESLVHAIEQVVRRGAELGLQEVVLGMPHRGRLNILTNVFNKSFTALFSEFQGNSANPEDVQGSGDVKYHLGTSSDRDFGGHTVHLTMNANPSHLEAVNPVVEGRVRAKQQQRATAAGVPINSPEIRSTVLPVLLHGDAAFAGQGLVAETLAMSDLIGYRTGGTIHFVVNNQVGFTTNPVNSRSGPYATDIALMIHAPIFHVNGDDPEAVAHVSSIAIEFRQKFQQDVVIDMFCYRRQGHNESDEPAFTQPLMYKAIKVQPTTRDLYAQKLTQQGVLGAGEADRLVADFAARLEADFEAAKTFKPNKADWLEGKWQGFETASGDDRRGVTGVDEAALKKIGYKLSEVPTDIALNPKIVRQLEAKRAMIDSGEGIDWATAEALAFGSLMTEGTMVRLSGQDVGRGTFSQRHAVMTDQANEAKYIPLTRLSDTQAHLEIFDSHLSEAGVLGFEYGYSLVEPNALVMWEAQFGDFSNGAQVIFDQFISSAESKWLRMSGLTMLLPHGYEGQGPEHSSCRIERFLQLCGEDNWQVANCTTPANYFHILRRQVKRPFRKPLVIATPKSLLRHKQAVSRLDELMTGTTFHRVLPETEKLVADGKVRRVVLCTGKVYYDLLAERDAKKITDVALVRIEQLYPFPAKSLAVQLSRYPKADVVWCQEEPENMGAWTFVDRRIEKVLTEIGHKAGRPIYAGRAEAASPATGLLRRHNKEQADLVAAALGI
jgi:2-oxoglutarate dehydrogenase E1 component